MPLPRTIIARSHNTPNHPCCLSTTAKVLEDGYLQEIGLENAYSMPICDTFGSNVSTDNTDKTTYIPKSRLPVSTHLPL
jgi:hypothetical protein